MINTLRERQRKVARDAILTALTDYVSEQGRIDFSVAEIAKRAGVSTRTLYNYFPTRNDLVEAVADWTDEAMAERGSTILPPSLDEVPDVIGPNFAIFEEMSNIATAFARLDTGVSNTRARARRTDAFAEMVREAFPDMAPRQSHALGALLRQLASVKAWYLLTHEHDLDTAEAGAVVSWAVEQLVRALRNGDFPSMPSDVEETS